MANKGRSLKTAKAEKAAKKRRARRRKRAIFMMAEIVTLLILLGIGYVMTKYGKLQLHVFSDGDIQVNEGVEQDDYTTVALFGGDSREGQLGAGTHADTIIVVSIDKTTKEIRMASIYRDTLVRDVDDEMWKANSAYFLGGPEQAINMLNRNMDLDIEHYATVDFKALADTIDLLGGIEIDVSDAEAKEVNLYISETAMVADKEAILIDGGLQTLDGVQAVTYARIRKNVGGDYARTERQRLVIQKIMEKVRSTDLSVLNDIIDEVLPQVSTSFSLSELIKLASGVMQYKIGDTTGFPFVHADAKIEGLGSVVVPVDFQENVEELHTFLYPKDEYEASQTVKDISHEIEQLTGIKRDDEAN